MGGDRLSARGDLERGAERLTAERSSTDGAPQQEELGLRAPSLRGALTCVLRALKLHFLPSSRFLWVARAPWFSLPLEVHCSKAGKQALWEINSGHTGHDNTTKMARPSSPFPSLPSSPSGPFGGN